jgi:hypothetical protein
LTISHSRIDYRCATRLLRQNALEALREHFATSGRAADTEISSRSSKDAVGVVGRTQSRDLKTSQIVKLKEPEFWICSCFDGRSMI